MYKASFRSHRALVALTALMIGAALAHVTAQEEQDPNVAYRQKLMRSIGANMGAIGDILKNQLPFPGTHIAHHAKSIQLASELIAKSFEKKIASGATDAKPEIWQDWDKFTAAAASTGTEAGKLAEVAEAGNTRQILAQVKRLGDACHSCHEPFRKPEEERAEGH